MHKIIYKNITINDNMMLIVQALIDKQAEIIEQINIWDKFGELEKLLQVCNEAVKIKGVINNG